MRDHPPELLFKFSGTRKESLAESTSLVVSYAVNRTAHQRHCTFRRALQKLDVALTTVHRRILQRQQRDIAGAQNGAVFVVGQERPELLVAGLECVEECPVVDHLDPDVRMIGQHPVQGRHDRCPIGLAVLRSKEDRHVVVRITVPPWRQVCQLILEHRDLRVTLPHHVRQCFGRNLNGMGRPDSQPGILDRPGRAARHQFGVVIPLRDDQPTGRAVPRVDRDELLWRSGIVAG